MRWLAMAAGVGGAVTLVLPGSPHLESLPVVVVAGTLVVLAAGVVLVVPGRYRPMPEAPRWADRMRWVPAIACLVAAGVAAWAWWAATGDRAAGFPAARLPLLAAAAGVAVVGLGALARVWWDDAGRARSVWVSLAVAVAAGAAPGLPVLLQPAVSTTRTANVPAGAKAPAGTEWKNAFSDTAKAVPIAGRAMAVLHGTGSVSAVDAATGRLYWRYTRTRAEFPSDPLVDVSPDGRLLVVEYETGRSGSFGRSVFVVLDAVTGAERWHTTDWTIPSGVTDGTVVVSGDPGKFPHRVVVGYDARSGDRRWRWRVPEGCLFVSDSPPAFFGSRVAMPTVCTDAAGSRMRVVLVDGGDGDEVARLDFDEQPASNPFGDRRGVVLHARADGRLEVYLYRSGAERVVFVDPADGRQLFEVTADEYKQRGLGE
jgi:hypothetical protein